MPSNIKVHKRRSNRGTDGKLEGGMEKKDETNAGRDERPQAKHHERAENGAAVILPVRNEPLSELEATQFGDPEIR